MRNTATVPGFLLVPLLAPHYDRPSVFHIPVASSSLCSFIIIITGYIYVLDVHVYLCIINLI